MPSKTGTKMALSDRLNRILRKSPAFKLAIVAAIAVLLGIVVLGILVAFSIVSPASAAFLLLCVLIILFSIVTLVGFILMRRILIGIDYLKKTAQEIAKSTAPLSETVDRIANLRKANEMLMSNSESVKNDIKSMKDIVKPDSLENGNISSFGRVSTKELSVFSPKAVRSVQVDKNSGGTAGRLAAKVEFPKESISNYTLALSEDRSRNRDIAYLGSDELKQQLLEIGNIKSIIPGLDKYQLETTPTYLIIEERANHSGPWAGFLDTQGTALFREVYEVAGLLKKNGTILIVIPDPTVYHFSSTLRGLADIVPENGRINLRWGIGFSAPVFATIDKYLGRVDR